LKRLAADEQRAVRELHDGVQQVQVLREPGQVEVAALVLERESSGRGRESVPKIRNHVVGRHLDVGRVRAIQLERELGIGQRVLRDAAIFVVELARVRRLLPGFAEQQRRRDGVMLQEGRAVIGLLRESTTRRCTRATRSRSLWSTSAFESRRRSWSYSPPKGAPTSKPAAPGWRPPSVDGRDTAVFDA